MNPRRSSIGWTSSLETLSGTEHSINRSTISEWCTTTKSILSGDISAGGWSCMLMSHGRRSQVTVLCFFIMTMIAQIHSFTVGLYVRKTKTRELAQNFAANVEAISLRDGIYERHVQVHQLASHADSCRGLRALSSSSNRTLGRNKTSPRQDKSGTAYRV
ncbi:hypothetical protein EDB86DRAFT_1145794 [Lactarius hatsudake]|nr:hypothetical protein EDB86DRAFT_1145794 [Lactarius hatsudake]